MLTGLTDSTVKKLRRATAQPMESLESRMMLAATVRNVFDIRNVPVTTPTSTNVWDLKNGPMSNVASSLVDIYREYRKYRAGGGASGEFDSSLTDYLQIDGDRVAVLLRARNGIEALTTDVRKLGGEIVIRSNKYSVVTAWMPITQLHALARDGDVATVNAISRPITGQAGNSDNQADEAQNADKIRSVYGLDGTGIKVGVLSDSVNTLGNGIPGSIATGNIPDKGIQVIEDSFLPASDEGRAMLELVHDIAPGADLAFATVGISQLTFAENIRALRAAGVDVFADDVIFIDEPVFQPGVIEEAVNDVTQDGAAYFVLAHNFNNGGFEAPTNFTSNGRLRQVDFDPDSPVDTRLRVEVTTPGQLILQWDNPYNGVAGNVTTDLDIYVWDKNYPNRLITAATTNNIRTGVPIERVILPSDGRFDIEIRVADHTLGTVLPSTFKLLYPINGGSLDTFTTEYDGNDSAIWGHLGSPEAITVGAVPFYAAEPFFSDPNIPFPPDEPLVNESFSGKGPVTRIFDSNGNRLTTPSVLQKPDISGIDDINTSFFGFDSFFDDDVLPNFSGTSAATPNVAAVGALIMQAAPNATAAQIKDALIATATPLNDAQIGEWDPQGGYGLIDGVRAVEQFVTNPTVDIIEVTPDPKPGPVDQIKFVFNQQVTGFSLANMVLTLDGGPNLLTGDNALVTTDGGRTWLLTNLTDLTNDPGQYTVEIVNPDLITNPIGLDLQSGITETWTRMPFPARPSNPSALSAKVISDTEVRLRWSDNSTTEDGFTIQRADDEAFTVNVKTFHVRSEDVTSFTDKILPTGRPLYYRVRAFNVYSGHSGYSNVAKVVTLSPGEIILDNESSNRVTINGAWDVNSSVAGFHGSSYLDDGNSGKGSKSVRYAPNFEFTDDYYVYARWTRSSNRATNVPIDIVFGDGSKKTVVVNQRNSGGNGWVLLGKFRFNRGTGGSVTIRTDGTNGVVVADAVRFLSAEGGAPVTPAD